MKYYIMVFNPKGGRVLNYGPFETEQERNDFACGLWFGKPVREPGALRPRRIRLDIHGEWIYYTSVTVTGRLTNVRNVTVGDLTKASCFPKDKK